MLESLMINKNSLSLRDPSSLKKYPMILINLNFFLNKINKKIIEYHLIKRLFHSLKSILIKSKTFLISYLNKNLKKLNWIIYLMSRRIK